MLARLFAHFNVSASRLCPFLQNERGTAAVEYALIAGVLVLAIVTGIAEIGSLTKGYFDNSAILASTGGR